MKKMLLLLVVLSSAWVEAALPVSAKRGAHESWQTARARSEFLNAFTYKPVTYNTAYDSRVKYSKLNINQIPEFGENNDTVQVLFEDVRNKRFLVDPDVAHFSRRITWLYPADGCFVRAELVSDLIYKHNPKAEFKRVFIFGNLSVTTVNDPEGYVNWWFHVAAIIRLQDKAFVIDPSLDPKKPIELSEWVQLMVSNPNQAELAICSSYAYLPDSDCTSLKSLTETEAADHANYYLRAERENLVDLGRDPDAELGNNPPW